MTIPDDPTRVGPEHVSKAEEILGSCFDEEDVEAAVDAACRDHPELAATLRSVFTRMRSYGLLAPGDVRGVDPTIEGKHPTIHGFTILERLGQGGMGVVYRAWQESPGREVAVKVVRPELLHFEGKRDRFAREIEAVARLSHPSIVPVLEVGESVGTPWFSMEYVHGASLDRVLLELRAKDNGAASPASKRKGSDLMDALARCLDVEAGAESASNLQETMSRATMFRGTWIDACLAIVASIASALEHAHLRGVLHRDVKPSNIMLTPDGRAMLFDFGLARLDDERALTRTTTELGSLPYLPPEALRGSSVPHERLDVYGLGMTLYELLCGRNPYLDASAERTRQRVLEGIAKRPRRVDSAIPWDVETVCMKAVAPEAEHRYASCAEFLADIDRLRDKLPINARNPGLLLRTRRWQQRHPRLTVAALTTLLLTTVSAIALLVREQHARREADAYLSTSERLRKRAERASYNTQIALAHASLLSGNDKIARRVLDHCDPALRNWVWHYHDLMVDAFEKKWHIHDSKSLLVASPNGETLASLSFHGGFALVDAARSTILAQRKMDATDSDGPAFSPDGAVIAVAETDAFTLLSTSDGSTKKRIAVDVRQHGPSFIDGRTLISIGSDGRIRTTDIESGRGTVILEFDEKIREVGNLSFDPFGRDIGVVSIGGKRVVFFRSDGTKLREVQTERRDIIAMSFMRTKRQVCIASSDYQLSGQMVETFDLDTGERTAKIPIATYPNSIALAPDDSTIAVASSTLRVFSYPDDIQGTRLMGHRGAVCGCAFDAFGHIWSTDDAGELCRWNTNESPSAATIHGHTSSILCLRVDPSSHWIVSGARNGEVQLSRSDTSQPVAKKALHEGRVLGAEFIHTPDVRVMTVGQDGRARVLSFPELDPISESRFDEAPVAAAPWLAGLAVLFENRLVHVDATGEQRVLADGLSAATTVATRGNAIAIGTKSGELRLQRDRVSRSLELHSAVVALDFDSEASKLAVVTDDYLVRLVDTQNMSILHAWDEHVTHPSVVRFAPGDDLVFSGAWGSSIRFWDPESDHGLGFTTIPGMVLALDPSPDGRFLAAAGIQGKILVLWATRQR
ncbi:MAG: protein kinase [Planctomycetes bacterium]|nr:protein kinase [Planctomycetota bacterium]